MFYTRKELETIEDQYLAAYGIRSKNTKGRCFPEDEPEYRTAYQRDRDRILHTTAFRRLEYKTQVFINYEGDYYRTRLTHTLEVSQIGRTIARALGANTIMRVAAPDFTADKTDEQHLTAPALGDLHVFDPASPALFKRDADP